MNRPNEPELGSRLTLHPQPPFRLDLTAWTLRRQAHNVVDRWDGGCFRRVLAMDSGALEVGVRQTGSADKPRLAVELYGTTASQPNVRAEVRRRLRRMLGLNVDLSDFYALAAREQPLDALAQRFMGMHPPRYLSLFEALANAVVCQQISLNVGIGIVNRLAENFGVRAGEGYAFVRPQDLLTQADPPALRALGLSFAKARTLLDLAERCASGALDERMLERLTDTEAIKALTQVRGIGRWSAEYVLLRGLSRWHIFPGDDVGARKYLAQWLQLEGRLDYSDVAAALHRWREYAGLIYFHLLLHRLDQAGTLQPRVPCT